jgi:hypothetical protein
VLESIEVDTILYCSTELGLDGIWGLSNYFDPILKERTISKHYGKIPMRFGIILEVKEGILNSYGSFIDLDENEIRCQSDTFVVFETYWGKWLLKAKDDELHLNIIPDEKHSDPTTYIYQKRPDLSHLIVGPDIRPYKMHNKMTEYFNQKLLAGSYINEVGDTVCFNFDGGLYGLDPYETYSIDSYLGTLHPFKMLDRVNLINRKERKSDHYHWEFKNDQLILTEFIHESTLYNGELIETDDYVLGEKQIRLDQMK